MDLGILSLTDIAGSPAGGRPPAPGRRVDEVVGYGLLAERVGLDVFGVGEHHSDAFAVSSPAVVLAAVAQGTERIRLSSAATVLSALDPVRVYQDFATVDLLSHGRAEIVAGRGAFAEPLALFGIDPAERDDVFAEKLNLLLRVREHETVSWAGRSRPPLLDAGVFPRAEGELPVWVGVGGSPTSALLAGDLGVPMMLGFVGGHLDDIRRLVDVYLLAGEQAGHPPGRLRVGLAAHLYVGATTAAAREDAYPYYRRHLSPGDDTGWDVTPDQMDDLDERGGALVVGGPERVAAKILDLQEALGVDRFLGHVDLGGMPRHLVETSVERFATEVAPVVRGTTV